MIAPLRRVTPPLAMFAACLPHTGTGVRTLNVCLCMCVEGGVQGGGAAGGQQCGMFFAACQCLVRAGTEHTVASTLA
jgi:hypothetical protein